MRYSIVQHSAPCSSFTQVAETISFRQIHGDQESLAHPDKATRRDALLRQTLKLAQNLHKDFKCPTNSLNYSLHC